MTTELAPLADRLLDATEAEIAETGTADIGVRAVARRAGVSHQAPLHHFGSGAGMLTALAIRGFHALRDALVAAEATAADSPHPQDMIEALGNAYVNFGTQHAALFAVMFRPEGQFVPTPSLDTARAEVFTVLERCILQAKARGWASSYDDQTLAFTCWAVVHGTVTLWRDGTAGIFFPGREIHELGQRVTAALNAAFGAG